MRNSSRRKMNNPSAGFTLIEVVLSIAILAIVSLPLLNYFTDSMRYSSMMEKRQQALFLAQEITEGLLAENRLVLNVTDSTELEDEDGNKLEVDEGYTVPFLVKKNYTQADTGFQTSGEGEAVFTATTEGYDVVVTITVPPGMAVDDVQDFSGYGFDSSMDVVHIDTMENNKAVFDFMGVNSNYLYEMEDRDLRVAYYQDEEYIRDNMSRVMYVDLSVDESTEEYRVEIYYEYTCPKIMGDAPFTLERSKLLDKTVENLRNIYILYDWCKGGDTVILSDVDGKVQTKLSADSGRLGLNIIYQQKADVPDNEKRPNFNEYVLTVDRDKFLGALSLYTNVGEEIDGSFAGDLKGTLEFPLNRYDGKTLVGSLLGDGEPTLVFSVCTEVYSKGHNMDDDPLAVIETTKGE